MAGLINKSLPFTSDGYYLVAGDAFGVHTQILPTLYNIIYMLGESNTGKLDCEGMHLTEGFSFQGNELNFTIEPVPNLIDVMQALTYIYHANEFNKTIGQPGVLAIETTGNATTFNSLALTPINNFL